LTGEKVVFDIASVKTVKLAKASSSKSVDTFSSVRLQIWHELDVRAGTQSDTSSFVTAGTALSGPTRDKMVASSSRLMIFLGRTGQYVTTFSEWVFWFWFWFWRGSMHGSCAVPHTGVVADRR
jgi:hypothetical protein